MAAVNNHSIVFNGTITIPNCSVLPEPSFLRTKSDGVPSLPKSFLWLPAHPDSLAWHYEILLLHVKESEASPAPASPDHPILCSSPASCFHLPEYLLFHIFLPLAMLFLCIKCPSLPCPSLPFKFSAPSSMISWQHQGELITPSSEAPLELKGVFIKALRTHIVLICLPVYLRPRAGRLQTIPFHTSALFYYY